MNECEWKDGKFVPCEENNLRKEDINYDRCTGEYFCPRCGGFISKPEPKAPTHEEIMTKWWKHNGLWRKVSAFSYDSYYTIGGEPLIKEWFTNRESADIPPE